VAAAERTRADLERMVDDLNRNHFGGKVQVDSIDWMPIAYDRKHLATQETPAEGGGTNYTYKGYTGLCRSQSNWTDPTQVNRKNTVTITNIFRSREVPDEMVERTVGHEMIHALLPQGEGHSPRFYTMESQLPTYQQSVDWEARGENIRVICRLISDLHRGVFSRQDQPSNWPTKPQAAKSAPVAQKSAARPRPASRPTPRNRRPVQAPEQAAAAFLRENSSTAVPGPAKGPQAPRKTSNVGRQGKTAGRGGKAIAGAAKVATDGAAIRAQRVAHFLGLGCRDNDVCSAPECKGMCQDYMPFCVQCWKGRLTGTLRYQCWKVCLDSPSQQHPTPTPAQQEWFDAVMVHMGVDPDYVGGPYMFKYVPERPETGTVRAVWCVACWAPYVWGRPELTRCNTRPGPIIRARQDALTKEHEMETISLADLNNPKAYQNVKEIAAEYTKNIDGLCAEMERMARNRR
jgi:hypothetical protein